MTKFTTRKAFDDYIATVNGRLTAQQIDDLKPDPKELILESTAAGAHIPIVYGRKAVPGIISAFAINGSGNLCVRVVWAAGECEEVEAVFINDAAPPVGVVVTHYEGTTTQTEDTTMDAAITAYSDTMILSKPAGDMGLCYTVFEIAVSDITNAPRFQAIIKGKLVDDPDEVNPIYSDNPALCFGELASNPIYGLGVTVTGLKVAKDWCDEEIATGVVRSRVSLAIASSRRTEEYLDLLATQADCIWFNNSDGGVTLLPDSVVDPADYWLEETFVKNSLTIQGIANSDTPTKVTVRYTEPETTTANWEEMTTSQQLPGVDTGDVPLIETTLDLRGIWREEEALNKANARLLRMQNRVRVSWTSADIGLAYQVGDVVNVKRTERGVDVLVLVDGIQLIDYGRHKVTGLRYDPDHYPTELPVGTGTLPVGAITLLSGTTVPSGWQAYNTADGSSIIVAGNTYAVGATGGATTHAGLSGDTTTDGDHNESGTTLFNIIKALAPTGAGYFRNSTATVGGHNHTFSTGTLTPDPYTRENSLIKKISSSDTVFPKDAMIFGLGGLSVANLVRNVTYQNRLLKAAAASANSGSATKAVAIAATGATDDGHSHHTTTNLATVGTDFSNSIHISATGGTSHTHSITATLTRNIKRYKTALYAGTDEYTVVPGMMILWDGSLVSLPVDWYLCDGNNTTPDMTDQFIEIASNGNEDATAGDNTIDLAGTSNTVTHSHHTSNTVESKPVRSIAHSNEVGHNHSITGSGSWTPPYYALAVLMYAP